MSVVVLPAENIETCLYAVEVPVNGWINGSIPALLGRLPEGAAPGGGEVLARVYNALFAPSFVECPRVASAVWRAAGGKAE